MEKFVFDLKTIGGLTVKGITIMARDKEAAMLRLGRMYPNCQVTSVRTAVSKVAPPPKSHQIYQEDIVTMISRQI
jgi:hypothetical protein